MTCFTRFISIIFSIFCMLETVKAQTVIFEDGFETGSFGAAWTAQPNLSGVNGIVEVTTVSPMSEQFAVRLGRSSDGGSNIRLGKWGVLAEDKNDVGKGV